MKISFDSLKNAQVKSYEPERGLGAGRNRLWMSKLRISFNETKPNITFLINTKHPNYDMPLKYGDRVNINHFYDEKGNKILNAFEVHSDEDGMLKLGSGGGAKSSPGFKTTNLEYVPIDLSNIKGSKNFKLLHQINGQKITFIIQEDE